MKKIIASVLLLAVLASLLSVSTFAVSKSDLLAEAAKSPVYEKVRVAVENAARNVEVTDEQAEALLPLVQSAVETLNDTDAADASTGLLKNYTQEQIDAVLSYVDQACEIMDLHYTLTPNAGATAISDMTFVVYTEDNTPVFEYDGNAVADTAVEESTGSVAALATGIVLLVAGLGSAYVVKKHYASTAA